MSGSLLRICNVWIEVISDGLISSLLQNWLLPMSVGKVAHVSFVPDCAFQLDFLPSNLYFSVVRESTFEFMLHRHKNSQLTWRFSANRSKASFSSVHRSAVELRLNAVFFSFFFFASGDRNNAKTLCKSPFTIPQCLAPLESKLSQNLYMAARD